MLFRSREAVRKYEEALVELDHEEDPRSSRRLLTEAIALWEQLLAEAVHDEHRDFAARRLSQAYVQLAEVETALGDHSAAERMARASLAWIQRVRSLRTTGSMASQAGMIRNPSLATFLASP